jgi:hypothetical protein
LVVILILKAFLRAERFTGMISKRRPPREGKPMGTPAGNEKTAGVSLEEKTPAVSFE